MIPFPTAISFIFSVFFFLGTKVNLFSCVLVVILSMCDLSSKFASSVYRAEIPSRGCSVEARTGIGTDPLRALGSRFGEGTQRSWGLASCHCYLLCVGV
jgi:hypothetical protein